MLNNGKSIYANGKSTYTDGNPSTLLNGITNKIMSTIPKSYDHADITPLGALGGFMFVFYNKGVSHKVFASLDCLAEEAIVHNVCCGVNVSSNTFLIPAGTGWTGSEREGYTFYQNGRQGTVSAAKMVELAFDAYKLYEGWHELACASMPYPYCLTQNPPKYLHACNGKSFL